MSARPTGVHERLDDDLDLVCDVCVIGSGAGGAVVAARLAAMGLEVVILEEGPYRDRRSFRMDEGEAYRTLYQDRGLRATQDLSITILQGRAVGGSTVVNWTTCFRVPDAVLHRWARDFGVRGLSPETLAPHFQAVEARLGIAEWPAAAANANNRVLFEGCRKLGYEVGPLRRNVRGCANLGYCGMGCPVDAKQAMHVTYLPDAFAHGARLYANVRAHRVEVRQGRAVDILGVALDPETARPTGRRLRVRPKAVVASFGALNTPTLLLRSGLDDGKVGKRTFLHPTVAMASFFDEPVQAFYGAPQSIGSHHFADRGPGRIGFFLETPPVHPMLAATAFPAFGQQQLELMSRLGHMQALIALAIDGFLPEEAGGTVRIDRDGRMRFFYPIGPPLEEAFCAASIEMARIQLAAGAREVRSLHLEPVVVRTEADLPRLERAPYGALRHSIFSAHQMGGCPMGEDEDVCVVDSTLRHRRVDNLFVVDGSVFPTSLGVNPSETIYALAHWAAEPIAAAIA
ncbi:MAG TPA: GMC family oxidoreductase [Fredinandcohnia sp.]|nr:GMC family oxidoreductase [Fredinandcohnia sp.]